MNIKILNEGFDKKYLMEKELSSIEGTASNSLVNWWNGYDPYGKSVKEIYNDLLNAIPEDRKKEPKVKRLLMRVMQSKRPDSAMMVIANFVLAGDDQKVKSPERQYESLKRNIRKQIKK